MNNVQRMAAVLALGWGAVAAQPASEFTYQGRLSDNGIPAVGSFDFELNLYDAASGGTLLLTHPANAVTVTDGVFSITIDFAAVPDLFDDRQVWVEVEVAEAGQTLELLAPRTELRPATQASYAVTAGALLVPNRLDMPSGTDADFITVMATVDLASNTVIRQYGGPGGGDWIDSIQHLGTGTDQLTFKTGLFSDIPICTHVCVEPGLPSTTGFTETIYSYTCRHNNGAL